ncbi:MAG: hypothetical protein GF341_02495 [candidate division Zixibacteria bacterium]|nr:hypothetical protein [candidate division Zixibacteria bacterium]
MTASRTRGVTRQQWLIMGGAALISILAHTLTNGNYGIFRDELYYWDSTRHVAWGYVDHPPLSIAVLKLSVMLFGDSVGALRIVPALCGGLLIILIGVMAAEFGADRFGVLLASLSALTVPLYLVNTGFYSMNALDLVLWALLFYVLVRIIRTRRDRLWIAFGILLGLAALNKLSVAAFVVALIPALLLTGHAHVLTTRQFWLGAIIAVVLVAPFVAWQVIHEWPTLEFIRNAAQYKIVEHSFPSYLQEQILPMGAGLLPVWVLGLVALLVWRPLRPYRLLGIIWLGALLFFGLQRSKPYYLSTAYAPLYAAGATLIAHWIRPWGKGVRIAVSTLVVVTILASAAATAPLTLPVLPPTQLVEYTSDIGMIPSAGERGDMPALPQYYADRFGWEAMTATVADVYHSLPDSLRRTCTIIARNYGETGALNYYGREYGLPRVMSQHNSHYLWGYGSADGNVLLTVNYNPDDLRNTYANVRVLDTFGSRWAMPYETDAPICLCTGLLVPWEEAWRRGKLYL